MNANGYPATNVHRKRDGRMEIDYFSRRLQPRWKLIKIDGVYYDRKSLANWLLTRGASVPTSRRPFTAKELENIRDPNPYGLLKLRK